MENRGTYRYWVTVNLKDEGDSVVGAIKYPLIKMVEDTFKAHEPPIVTIKKKGVKVNRESDAIWNKHKDYMTEFSWYRWNIYRGGQATLKTKMMIRCDNIMKDHGEGMIKLFLVYTYKSIENAILQTENLTQLWNEFLGWFDKWKEEYMSKVRAELTKEIEKKTGVAISKKPHSCGGVANLLRVLTKTMHEQGADIKSIAKMQYSVCLQQGVWLPDEFITDVATVLDIEAESVKDFGELANNK